MHDEHLHIGTVSYEEENSKHTFYFVITLLILKKNPILYLYHREKS